MRPSGTEALSSVLVVTGQSSALPPVVEPAFLVTRTPEVAQIRRPLQNLLNVL